MELFTHRWPEYVPTVAKTINIAKAFRIRNHKVYLALKATSREDDIKTLALQTRFDAGRRTALCSILLGASSFNADAKPEHTSESTPRSGDVQHSEQEWRHLLPPAAYRVLRQGGTELPLSSPLYREKRRGTYRCLGCHASLFASAAKYESRTGWPSFSEALDNSVVELVDYSIPFYPRTEVRCKRCGGHIGHVFPVRLQSLCNQTLVYLMVSSGKPKERLVQNLKENNIAYRMALLPQASDIA